MKYEFKTSFKRSLKKLPSSQQLSINEAIETLQDFLDKKISLPGGLGLKHYGSDYWEIRADLSLRVLFEMDHDRVVFYFVGDHDDVRHFVQH